MDENFVIEKGSTLILETVPVAGKIVSHGKFIVTKDFTVSSIINKMMVCESLESLIDQFKCDYLEQVFINESVNGCLSIRGFKFRSPVEYYRSSYNGEFG